ncbi:hypothetical protein PAXRUDRAFT_20296 [Paxillus rubicundulus Ve08.2h10]|uniref:Uncharacterized protein n=1 Tax=Paxillus rubicundulus Ve08.2h10 TaxID=930991 RepID=A0A0D0DA20_9AGAM|nr:hypothetical protein PAXRUDRAFT_20296 [Paxillus rubicundulus Ve08.2h10]
MGYYETTANHWARYAFLHASMVTFNEIVNEGAAALASHKKAKQKRNHTPCTVTPEAESEAANNSGASQPEAEAEPDKMATTSTTTKDTTKIWTVAEYWDYVDLLLCKIRDTAVAKEQTTKGHKKFMEA